MPSTVEEAFSGSYKLKLENYIQEYLDQVDFAIEEAGEGSPMLPMLFFVSDVYNLAKEGLTGKAGLYKVLTPDQQYFLIKTLPATRADFYIAERILNLLDEGMKFGLEHSAYQIALNTLYEKFPIYKE